MKRSNPCKEEQIYYVYAHYTLDTNELFYIGKGKKNRAKSSFGRNRYWHFIVKKHGFRSEIIIDSLPEPRAYIQEILGIKKYKPVANLTKGGEGGSGLPNSGSFKKGLTPWNKNKKCPQISKNQLGVKNPVYGKLINNSPIKCLENNISYKSVKEACKDLRIAKSSIDNYFNGKFETAAGYTFRYEKQDFKEQKENIAKNRENYLKNNPKKQVKKRIKCIETGMYFESISECSRVMAIQMANITKVLTNKRKTAGGFGFKYV